MPVTSSPSIDTPLLLKDVTNMAGIPESLANHLLTLNPEAFKAATQTPFLEKAGKGALSKEILQEWLAQDRLYAQAYLRFATLLLANIPPPTAVSPNHINERLIDLILDAINNIRRELKFFEDVAHRYGLNLEASVVSVGVQKYRSLFSDIGDGIEKDTHSVLDGVLFLWGTERSYLDAWTYASMFSSPGSPPEQDADGGALRKEFIPNWTSDGFVDFVDRCAKLMDEIWTGQQTQGIGELLARGAWRPMGTDREREKIRTEWLEWVKGLWERIIEAEMIFWPDVEDE
jgi:thiaminase